MKTVYLFLTLFLVTLTTHAATNSPQILAQNGHSNYVIVLPNDAIPPEKTAAQQLQKYFLQMTDVTLPIKSEGEVVASAAQILVGNSARAKVLLPDVNWNDLGKDGILIQTAGNDLVLAGDRPRGSLYAVFQFLEEAGCRFWFPGAYQIPHKSTLLVNPQKVHYVPPFAYRENSAPFIYHDEEFATMMRENGNSETQTEEWGGHYEILGWVHTFSKLLPVEKYFADHPEWYSDPANGFKPSTSASKMPSAQGTDLCMGNPQVVDAVTEQALAWIKKNPDAGYISISHNDDPNSYCRDDYAVDLIKKEGSPSAPLLDFVNKVAARIHQIYPNVIVSTLAYLWSESPPKMIRPGKNVIIRLAPVNSDYGQPLNSDRNAKTRDNLLAWEKISPQLFVWNYTTNFYNMLMPHPNIRTLGTDMQFFAAHHVTGVFEQANYWTNNVGDFEPLRVYLTGKLMWNPSLDQNQVIDEFMRGYYGAAAPSLHQYLELIEDSFPRDKQKLSIGNNDFSFLTLDVLNRSTRLFDQAAAAVKNDDVLSERVAKERFTLNLAWLTKYRYLKFIADQDHSKFLGPADPQEALTKWKADADRWVVKWAGELISIDSLIQQLKSGILPPQPLPAFAQGLAPEDVIDVQPGQFDLSKTYGSIVDDANASGNTAARVEGDTAGWAIKVWLGKLVGQLQLRDSSWKVVALARVEMKPGAPQTGTGIQGGIFDVTNLKTISSVKIPLMQLADGKYHQIELGDAPLNGGMYLWMAPIDNPNVAAIDVDRIVLMRE